MVLNGRVVSLTVWSFILYVHPSETFRFNSYTTEKYPIQPHNSDFARIILVVYVCGIENCCSAHCGISFSFNLCLILALVHRNVIPTASSNSSRPLMTPATTRLSGHYCRGNQ